MAKKKTEQPAPEEIKEETAAAETEVTEEPAAEPTELELLQAKYDEEHDNYLRLAAEYDNFRKRSQKEREALYTDIKAETTGKFLPVFDNLLRALNQETQDEAYKKGVEMTMNQLVEIFTGLGVEIFGAVGDSFDPELHNAILHIEDENFGEGTVSQVFQKGFKIGEKVVRFAMVQVAN